MNLNNPVQKFSQHRHGMLRVQPEETYDTHGYLPEKRNKAHAQCGGGKWLLPLTCPIFPAVSRPNSLHLNERSSNLRPGDPTHEIICALARKETD